MKSRDDIPLLLVGKSSFKLVLMESTSPMQLNDWPLVEVALLLICLTHVFFDKNQF
jgi:hypothetical protein